MNSALLAELQRQSAYPSVTVLLNTLPGSVLTTAERARAGQLIDTAAERLRGDVADGVATGIVARLRELLDEQSALAAGSALAICVSPTYAAAVKLGRSVTERVVVDETFATRDLVADLNRTAEYRLLTISERTVRSFIGDRFHTIGYIPGNHDRTGWAALHNAAWPVVCDWLRGDVADTLERLDASRSSRHDAGGVQEIWSLANDGRVDTLIVEDGHALAARVTHDGQLHPTGDAAAPDVVDDIVDETIEVVLRHGGRVVVTEPGELAAHHHIAAVLRY
jgi:hypothetical protein